MNAYLQTYIFNFLFGTNFKLTEKLNKLYGDFLYFSDQAPTNGNISYDHSAVIKPENCSCNILTKDLIQMSSVS